jgi:hypothetical protein
MIILEPTEVQYLLAVLTRQNTWWVRDSILGKLVEQDQKWQKHKACKHSFKKYNIQRKEEKCEYCGVYDIGMGFEEHQMEM